MTRGEASRTAATSCCLVNPGGNASYVQSGGNCNAQPAIVGKRAKAEAKVDWKIVALPVKLDGKIKGARQEDFLDLT